MNLLYFFVFFFQSLSMLFAQVGIGTTNPNPSAALHIESTTRGFLPPRLSNSQRDAISSPAEGLTLYNTNNKCLEFWNGKTWISACDGSIVGACEGVLAPIGFEIVQSSGKCWLDRDLGATQTATSPTDHLAYGNFYQWGRLADGHELMNWTSGTSGSPQNPATVMGPISNHQPAFSDFVRSGGGNWYNGTGAAAINDLWKEDGTGVNEVCPAGWRVPTLSEWQNEINSWSSANAVGAIASPLKLTLAAYRDGSNGNISCVIFGCAQIGQIGQWWSSTGINNSSAYRLTFNTVNGVVLLSSNIRSNGLSIRCIKN
jgi:uncharacterized protein (TIGR02145 family)